MPKKNFMALGTIFGCQITILWGAVDQKSQKLPISGLFSLYNLKKSWTMALKFGMHIKYTLNELYGKIFLCVIIFRYQNLGKNVFFLGSVNEKCFRYPP